MDPKLNRRAILRAVPATLIGGVGSQALTGTATAAGTSGSGCQYTLEQGSMTKEVVPLSNGITIEEFYGGSSTQTGIERALTSIVFLWEGPRGMSLVVVNSKSRSTWFGVNISVEFEFDGLPVENGSWVVTDDRSDFDDPETDTAVHWTWSTGNRDGGAFRGGLDGGFEVAVDTNSGFLSVTDLQFLSGDPADPERIPLDLGRGFTIKGEGCSIEADLDIKPSGDTEDENPINLNRRGGNIPVAILNTDDFDPADVDFDSLRFGSPEDVKGGGGAEPAHSDPLEVSSDGDLEPVSHWEDVDDDGDLDLVVHFPAEDTGFDGDEDVGRLEGNTKDGTPLFGTDSVTFVGSDNGGGRGGGGGSGGSRGGRGGGGRGRGRR